MSGTQSAEISVIDAFLRACPDGDPATVGRWCGTHPDHADAIIEAAATIILAPSPGMRTAPGEAIRAARRSATIAQAEAILAAERPARTLRELIVSADSDLPAVADALDLEREALAEVEAGHVAFPLPGRLVAGLTRVLQVATSVVEAALVHAYTNPRLGHASSDGEPTVGKVAWREVIEDSDMSPERKTFWLEEDRTP